MGLLAFPTLRTVYWGHAVAVQRPSDLGGVHLSFIREVKP